MRGNVMLMNELPTDLPTDAEPVKVVCGDCLEVLRALPDGCVDAVVTDPPYSSGGRTKSERAQTVAAKYVNRTSRRFRAAEFEGDNRDQRSWAFWCYLWLSECLRVAKPGAYILTFTDWRQLPMLADMIQAGGWLWRGILAWDKGPGARAPGPHYFRHQCEYVVWGTRGSFAPPPDWPPEGKGCYPGCYSISVDQKDKHHVVAKPTKLIRDLLYCVPPGGVVLDPFAGSGTTGVAAKLEGRRALLIEKASEYCEIICNRLAEASRT
jgi:site-specific DNA-methyltransferase (adenine-specific)